MRDVTALPSAFEMTNTLLAMTGHRHAQVVGDTDREPFDGDTALALLGPRGDVAVLFVTLDGDVYGFWDPNEGTPYTHNHPYPFGGAVLLFKANNTQVDVVTPPTALQRTARPVGGLPLALPGEGFIAYRRDLVPVRTRTQARHAHLPSVQLSSDPDEVRPRDIAYAQGLRSEGHPMTIVIDGAADDAIDTGMIVERDLFVAVADKDIARTLIVRLS